MDFGQPNVEIGLKMSNGRQLFLILVFACILYSYMIKTAHTQIHMHTRTDVKTYTNMYAHTKIHAYTNISTSVVYNAYILILYIT